MVGQFGRHVLGRSDQAAHLGQRAVSEPGDTEVGQLQLRPVARGINEQVLRLDVAVNYSCRMNGGEAVEKLASVTGDLSGRERALCEQFVPQVLALDVLHDYRQGLALDDEVNDPDDVGVFNRQQDRAFLYEPGDDVRIGYQFGFQHLYGNRRLCFTHGAAIYPAHPALADALVQHIAAAKQFIHALPPRPFAAAAPIAAPKLPTLIMKRAD